MATAYLPAPPRGVTLVSKPDNRDWTKELWRAAYRQARSMVKQRPGHGLVEAQCWFLEHARRRFGPSGWRVAQAAARLVFDTRLVHRAASGSLKDLQR
jgi:hypothetical protein